MRRAVRGLCFALLAVAAVPAGVCFGVLWAVFRLTVKRGSFFYDQQLGSRLYTLKGSYGNREMLSENAMQMVREALKPMAEVTPLGVRASMTGSDRLSLTVSLLADRKQMELEVLI